MYSLHPPTESGTRRALRVTVGGVAIVTGATGQDGYLLSQRLLRDGWTVHAIARSDAALAAIPEGPEERTRYHPHRLDILDAVGMVQLIRDVGPDEIYNLAGQSSVSRSFDDPLETWRTNADAVFLLLEALRQLTPAAKMYQSSSGEMFGWGPESHVLHDERALFAPQSPYAVAKAAAHLACGTYRRVFGLRVACGILFNHESHRRPDRFLTRKVVDHVRRVRDQPGTPAPLRVGNLLAQRDWGYAPDYVDGIVAIIRQVSARAERMGAAADDDRSENYRDYVLATGQLHAVWQFIDRAFAMAGYALVWQLESDDERRWHARYENGDLAVEVDPDLLRPSDPLSIAADPSLARRELGWDPQVGLDPILRDMLGHA